MTSVLQLGVDEVLIDKKMKQNDIIVGDLLRVLTTRIMGHVHVHSLIFNHFVCIWLMEELILCCL
jgi:hypothetical protein